MHVRGGRHEIYILIILIKGKGRGVMFSVRAGPRSSPAHMFVVETSPAGNFIRGRDVGIREIIHFYMDSTC